ncbi:MAG: CBS domain-containing protein [Planctomycetes bacterium]|nr:CBS domain-containing protein [Planctomycetota bacterium]
MPKVRDAMVGNPISVALDTPTYEAMRILVEQNITGLPVVGGDGSIQGIVTEKDMLSLLFGSHEDPGPVEGIMTRDVVCFDADDELVDVCKCLDNNNFRRVPILENGKLAGIVSRKDIIKFILRLRKKDKPSE